VYDLFVAASLRGFDNSARDTVPTESPWDDEPTLHAGDPLTPGTTGPTGTPGDRRPVHLLEVLGPDAAAISDGVPLDGPSWAGDDLIVCVDRDQADAILLGDMPTPAPTRLRTLHRGPYHRGDHQP
jgi:hypothetical protein